MSPQPAEVVTAIASTVAALATCVTAAGVWYAHRQLQSSREIAQLQFEDALAKEYRDLANRLPPAAHLGEELYGLRYRETFDEFFHYVDLSNQQVLLRGRGRIGQSTWEYWRDGIQWNLSLPAFRRAWEEVKAKSESFQELRRLEREGFLTDPLSWNAA